jgi:hypothetical protein
MLLSTDTEIRQAEVTQLRAAGAIAREYRLDYDLNTRHVRLGKRLLLYCRSVVMARARAVIIVGIVHGASTISLLTGAGERPHEHLTKRSDRTIPITIVLFTNHL